MTFDLASSTAKSVSEFIRGRGTSYAPSHIGPTEKGKILVPSVGRGKA